MSTIISILNKSGAIFCQHGLTMLVQFGLLTSLLFLADILIRKRVKASLRYCLWSLVLIKLVLPTTLTLPTGIGDLTGVNFSVQLTQVKLPEPQIQTVYAPTTSMPVQTGSEFARPIKSQQDIAESPVSKAAESPVSAETIPLNWQGGIFIAWLFGVVLLLAEFIRRIVSIKKLITQSKPASERLADMVHTCQKRIGVKGIVELRLSNNMVSPAVCGLLRHIIIVPTGLLEEMDRSKLAMVLMHELSHIKRADLWVNLFQTILQIFYFYNPFVWAANAYIRRVREQAVDEMVLTRLNCAAASYSNTLIDIAEKAFSRPQFRLATVSIIESKSKLKERIKIMLSKPIPKDTKIGFAGLVLIIAVAAVLLPMAKAKDGSAVDNHSTVMVKESAGIDVGVEDFNIMPYPEGGLYTVTVSIRNRGRMESPKFGVNFYRGDPNNVKPMTHGAGPIKPGDVWREGSMPFALKEGTNEIAVLLDPDNAIGEPNRTNNEASMTVIVKDGKIVEKKVSLSSAKTESGDTNGTNAGNDNRMSKQEQTGAPAVVKTTPVTFANDVSPNLNNLTVTFNQRMTDKSWSWTGGGETFPKMAGQPSYDQAGTTCRAPVKLEPGKIYWVGINSPSFQNFKSVSGTPAKQYVILFATKGSDGKPTPISEDLITKAKSVNESAQRTSSGPEGKESRTESVPYTQIIYDDIRSDGTITFKNTIRETNKSGKEITTQNFINSDFVEVTAMRGADGRDLKFTSVHDGDIYRYEVTFNEPIPPSGLIEYTSDGTMKGLIKPVAGSEKIFQYYMRHSPAAGELTRRVETYLLPTGAELISTTPTDMERRTKDGRIELHVEKMIPIDGSITTSFQYRVP